MDEIARADRIASKMLETCQERTEGWREETDIDQRPFQLVTEQEFAEQYLSQSLLDSFRQNTADAFRVLLSDDAIQKLVDITNGYLLHNHIYPSTDSTEYRAFLAHTLLVSCFRLPLNIIFDTFLRSFGTKHGFHVMELKRFQDLYQCTHGYPLEDHVRHHEEEHEDDAWLGRRSDLRKMEELERSLFEPSMKFMLNPKSALLVVDGERLSWSNRDESNYHDDDSSDNEADPTKPDCDYISDAVSGVRLGMRIRVRSEYPQESIEGLLNALPVNSPEHHKIRVCLDEGYGKMPFLKAHLWEKNYDVTTRACPLYSRQPFTTADEVEHLKTEWKEAELSEQVQQQAYNMLKPFFVDGNDRLGSIARVAAKLLTISNGETKIITSTAIRDKFDNSQTSKLHCFFSSGEDKEAMVSNNDIWVARGEDQSVAYNTLFQTRESPLPIETRLLEACHPVTLEQQSADWYCLRAFRLSGAAAETSDSLGGDVRVLRLRKCLDYWFGRHPSTFFAMRADYVEELPLIHKIKRASWIKAVYNIGLVEWKNAPFIAVSPDGVAEFSAGKVTQHACIEIKTRTDLTEIEDAEAAAAKHGTTVHCTFGDDVFRDCVPSDDRQQVLQQAIVTGFEYGIFVAAKAELGDEELIVQIVVVKIQARDKKEVAESMLRTSWLPSASDEAKVIKSQYRLWVAQYKKIRADGITYIPTYPLDSHEHSVHHLYNQAKMGLHNYEEDSRQVPIDIHASFETRYVFRMINAVFNNHWRFAQAIDKVLPYLAADDTNTMYDNAKHRMSQYEFGDHAFHVAIAFLVQAEIDKRIDRKVLSRLSQQDLVSENERKAMQE